MIAVLLARFVRRSGVRGPGAGLRVIDRVGLSREASLAVVQVGEAALVLGITAQSVSLLTTLDAASLPHPDRDTPGTTPGLDIPGTRRAGTGSVLDPRTWKQGLEALRDLTARR
ncbi:MAG: flagellar biosynthetic protein FliO [Kineosporiaceae bacterium]|nr:flagellar biosynthetic protein FliO [Kineosporiaceae bacterium]